MTKMSARLTLASLLWQIHRAEQELETIRELLNEEVQLTLQGAFDKIQRNSRITIHDIITFLEEGNRSETHCQIEEAACQSFITLYSCEASKEISLGSEEFGRVILCRQNNLLAKIVQEREQSPILPKFIVNYIRKLFLREQALHSLIVRSRNSSISSELQQLLCFRKEGTEQFSRCLTKEAQLLATLQSIKGYCQQHLNSNQHQCELMSRNICRYLRGCAQKQINIDKWMTLLSKSKSKILHDYIEDYMQAKNSSHYDSLLKRNPYIQKQFQRMQPATKSPLNLTIRQVRSIQKHLGRHRTSLGGVACKLDKYRRDLERQVKKVCLALTEILSIQRQSEKAREELCLCEDFVPSVFFDSFSKDSQLKLIPSSFEFYFTSLNAPVRLQHIFDLFRRYADPESGKITIKHFCNIFDTSNTKASRKNPGERILSDISVSTKKKFVNNLRKMISNQHQIHNIKRRLCHSKLMNLRDVFCSMDNDQDGYLSITDFRVAWRTFLNDDLSKENSQLLWFRMGARRNFRQLIPYDEFVCEMDAL